MLTLKNNFRFGLCWWTLGMRQWKSSKRLKNFQRFTYYVPLKRNRLVNDTNGGQPHQQVKDLSWTQAETRQGKRVHINKFPKGHQVKLFRIASSTGAQNILRQTTYLSRMRMRQNKNIVCVGRVNNSIVRSNKWPVLVIANVASCVPKEIILRVVSKYGSVWAAPHAHLVKRFMILKIVYWMITCDINSLILQ